MFFPKRKLIAFLFLFFVVLFIIFLSKRTFTYTLRSTILDLTKYPLKTINILGQEARALIFFHRSYWQNIRLREVNEEFKGEALKQEEIKKENERFRRLLELKRRTPHDVQAASVIGMDFHSRRPSLIIDKGRSSGFKVYAPVLTDSGLVGKAWEVGFSTSKLMLINDPNLSVPALNVRTREHGLVSGTLDGRCKLRFLDIDSDIRKGDLIVTSGLNKTYPKGIVIGRVKWVGVESSGLGRFAVIEPAVNVSSLEEVLIVVSSGKK